MSVAQKCLWCGKNKLLEKDFDKNRFTNNGYNPICKECKNNITDLDKFKLYLEDSNIKFDKHLWEEAEKNIKIKTIKKYKDNLPDNFNEIIFKKTMSKYFSLANLSNGRDFSPIINKNKIKKEKINKEQLEMLKEKFGEGYPDEEYILFEKKYQQLRPSFQLLTTMHDECLREYCINKVKENLAKAKGDFKEAKEWAQMAQSVATSGKLNPSQMSKADLSGGLDTFGQLVKAVEQEEDIIPLLPKFIEKPKDKVDVVLWHLINYVRDLKGLPFCEYKDIYAFYEKRKEEYENHILDKELNEGVVDA